VKAAIAELNINVDSRDWQEVAIPPNTRLVSGAPVGDSFNVLKLKLVRPDDIECRGTVKRETKKLETANGYHNLDGREVTVTRKKSVIFLIRVEDCGLGSAKADALIQMLGFKF
jgi:hypothetical protein